MPTIKIIFNEKASEHTALSGQTLLPFLRDLGYSLPPAPCGGNGRCGKCLVNVVRDGKSTTEPACLTLTDTDMTVLLEEISIAVYDAAGYCHFRPDKGADGIGAAIDIGTTTIVLYLADLADGRILAVRSGPNRQRGYGADVISRAQHIMENPDGLYLLTEAIRRQIGEYLLAACAEADRAVSDLKALSVCGNTIMEHIFAGLSPESIAIAPSIPLSLFGESIEAGLTGLPISHGLPVYIAPCLSGYVGGDIMSGLLASGAYREDGNCLFLDIGTNGELALGMDGSFLCCATAAGPAFEGAEVSCGMAGMAGAISRVWIDDKEEVRFKVIGNASPTGICGSGLIDALAVLLELGLIDKTGRLLPKDEVSGPMRERLAEKDGRVRFYLDENIYISDADVRKLQLAKAAIAAGIQTLLTETGLRPEDIHTVHLAGGFGNYMDKNSAARIGLIPGALADKIVLDGNSAGIGAVSLLISKRAREEIEKLRKRCTYFELSGSAVFNDRFINCLTFG